MYYVHVVTLPRSPTDRWTQKELERGKNVAFSKSYFVKESEGGGLQVLCSSSYQANATSVWVWSQLTFEPAIVPDDGCLYIPVGQRSHTQPTARGRLCW